MPRIKKNNSVLKQERKIKKHKIPRTALDFFDNFTVDYNNMLRRTKQLKDLVNRVEWEAHEMWDAMLQCVKMLKKNKLEKKDIISQLKKPEDIIDENIKENNKQSPASKN